MKKIIKYLAIVTLLSVGFISCGTAPAKSNPEMTGNVFEFALDKVKIAGKETMITIECNLTKEEPLYLECKRPNKIGLAVGSGGETVSIYFESLAPNKTQVHVNTAKHFVGIVGQSNWDDKVIEEMNKAIVKKK